jgi:DNA-binding transcriptional regulator YhcF (GntR family)
MYENINIDTKSLNPVYKQLVECIERNIRDGIYSSGDLLPSMNELADQLGISKETVKKSYYLLRNKGYIEAKQGKGFYVSNIDQGTRMRILVLFDKLSNYKQVLFDSLNREIGSAADVTICLHNQSVDLLEYFLNENLDKYDYYIVTPHFPLDVATQRKVLKALQRIPNRKLILADHWIKKLKGNYGAVYQDFDNDAIDGLKYGLTKLKECVQLNLLTPPTSLYHAQVKRAVEHFCSENNIQIESHSKITSNIIRKNEVYLIINSQYDQNLIELIRIAREKGYKVGKDISIISYNESPISEIILDGLTTISTDFQQMGVLIARMILEKQQHKIKCDFRMIRRNSF